MLAPSLPAMPRGRARSRRSDAVFRANPKGRFDPDREGIGNEAGVVGRRLSFGFCEPLSQLRQENGIVGVSVRCRATKRFAEHISGRTSDPNRFEATSAILGAARRSCPHSPV